LESANEDPNKWNIKACQKLADIELQNNWNIDELYASIENFIKTYQI
jgi:sigma54-dependent transcription regulator